MSLELLEKRYMYLKEKERILRNTYDVKISNFNVSAASLKVHNEFLKREKAVAARGPYIKFFCKELIIIDGNKKEIPYNLIDQATETGIKELGKIKKMLILAKFKADFMGFHNYNMLPENYDSFFDSRTIDHTEIKRKKPQSPILSKFKGN